MSRPRQCQNKSKTRVGSAGILPASTFVATALAGKMPALPAHESKTQDQATHDRKPTISQSRVSQIVSLTGFSFVGGPAMNDSDAAAEFLQKLNRPYRSAVSLDTQTMIVVCLRRAQQFKRNAESLSIDGATELLSMGFKLLEPPPSDALTIVVLGSSRHKGGKLGTQREKI